MPKTLERDDPQARLVGIALRLDHLAHMLTDDRVAEALRDTRAGVMDVARELREEEP